MSRRLRRVPLAVEIVAEYVRVRAALRRGPLRQVLGQVRDRRLDRPPRGALAPERLAGGTRRVLAVLPVRDTCLFRSLVLIGLLARRGATGRLVIAAHPDGDLQAHAWVELDGRPLLAPEPEFGRLVEL